MNIGRVTILIALPTGVVLLVIAYLMFVVPKGELGEARGWSVLQSVEVAHRGDPDTKSPILLVDPLESNFVVLGLPSDDKKFPRTWLILDTTTPSSSIYLLPQGQEFHVSCSYLADLLSKVKIAPVVLALLKARCSD